MGQIGTSWKMESKSNKSILINEQSHYKMEKNNIDVESHLKMGRPI